MRIPPILALGAGLLLAGPGSAQFAGLGGSGSGTSGGGGLAGLAGALGGSGSGGLGAGLLPSLGSQSAGNAAGLLGYCVKNKLLGGAAAGSASSVLGQLTGQGKAKEQSRSYQAGQSGQLLAGGNALSLDGLKGKVKGKLCDMVLQHAQSFL